MNLCVSPEYISSQFGHGWMDDGAITVQQGVIVSQVSRVEVTLFGPAKKDDRLCFVDEECTVAQSFHLSLHGHQIESLDHLTLGEIVTATRGKDDPVVTTISAFIWW